MLILLQALLLSLKDTSYVALSLSGCLKEPCKRTAECKVLMLVMIFKILYAISEVSLLKMFKAYRDFHEVEPFPESIYGGLICTPLV